MRDDQELRLRDWLAELNERLQARIDSELEDLAEVLRGIIKKCIVEELKTQAPSQAANHKPRAPDEK